MNRPVLLLGGATLAVVVISLAALAVTGRGGEETAASTSVISDEVVDRFLDDFEASLTETYLVRSTFRRFRGESVVGSADVTVVQRLPDRLTRRGDSISGQLDGRPVTCDAEDCLIGTAIIDAQADVDEQVTTMREYVDGQDLLYGVSAIENGEVTRIGGESDRCYNLDLLRQIPLAPYGTLARFCFDAETGAPTLLRVERPEAIDVTVATDVTGEVTDADLGLPD